MRKNTQLNYYEMCREAKELQNEWKPYFGATVLILGFYKLQTINAVDNNTLYFQSKQNANIENCYWIPNKLELEEYLKKYGMMFKFYEFIHYSWKNYIKTLKTEEEFLLAFVMKQYYNKIWKNKIWKLAN